MPLAGLWVDPLSQLGSAFWEVSVAVGVLCAALL